MVREDRRGFSIVELLIVVGVLVILSGLTVHALRNLGGETALTTDAARVVAEIDRARSLTLASTNDSRYGVLFEPTRVTLYKVDALVPSPSWTGSSVLALHPSVRLTSVALTGGGTQIVFERLTGKVSNSGTVTLSLVGNPSRIKTITIYPTGAASTQ